jgi:glycosyltransferase involved in cell wall biosynthesis
VLYICLSHEWNTLERRCLADATYFRNIGGTPFILCDPKTLLDFEAEKEDIPRLYFQDDLKNWRGKLNFYFQIQHILQKQQIDIIHAYNADSLVPLGMILKSLAQIPLVFTFNENSVWNKNSFIDRWFISRTDSIFTFSSNIKEIATQTFPLNSRKIHVTGMGIDFPAKNIKPVLSQDKKKIVTFISRSEKELNHIRFFVDSIPPLLHALEVSSFGKKLEFSFFTDISWFNHPLYESIKRMILERHLEMFIRFETKPLGGLSFLESDVFVGLPRPELFSDQDLFALVGQTPVLLPRTSTRQQLIKQGKFGETYHPEDSREFRDKLLKILLNYDTYLEGLSSVEAEIQEQHHFERYIQHLYTNYEKLYAQRLRYSLKQKKLFS